MHNNQQHICPPGAQQDTISSSMSGVFYCGDNLEILTELNLVPPESVDLIYLDPPFNSRRTYNIVYKDSRAQEEAFKDYWSWEEAAPQYAKLLDAPETPPKLRTLLRGLKDLLIDDDADLLAYVAMMAPRLFALHRVLKSTGTLYLHCDPTASHYLKMVLDAVFGPGLFQNEIIWQRSTGKALASKRLPNNHDVVLAFRKSGDGTWNPDAAFVRYDPENLDEKTAKKYCHRDPDGRVYRLDSLINPNPDRPNLTYEFLGVKRVWRWTKERMRKAHKDGLVVQTRPGTVPQLKRYLDEQRGRPLGDVWTDIAPINSQAEERIGYPTQKPVALLRRIIEASSNPGDLILDPFCGCGTTIEACQRQGRRWIGIDIAAKAVEITEQRFKKQGWDPPEVRWYPPDRDAAEALAKRRGGGVQFEAWALRKIRAAKRRKHDRGIDGEAFFKDEHGKVTHVLVSVKSGKLKPEFVRELRGTIERERAPIGVLLCLHDPTKEMRREATHAGYLRGEDGRQIPRIQFLTVDQIFQGIGIEAPGVNVTEMPQGVVPNKVPEHEQLSLRLEPPKPPRKTKAAAPARSVKRPVASTSRAAPKKKVAARR